MKPYSLLVIGGRGGEPQQIAELIHSACPGMTVDILPSGHEAFFYLREKKPSAIMIDFMLTDIDGISFLKIIKESDRMAGVPVLIMSGTYTEPADRAAVLFAGASGFIQKPLDPKDSGWGAAFCRELAYQLKISIEKLNAGTEETELSSAGEKKTAGNESKNIRHSSGSLPEEAAYDRNRISIKFKKNGGEENKEKSARGRKKRK